MDASEVTQLYDSFWFETEIFKRQPNSEISLSFAGNPVQENQGGAPKLKISSIPTMISRTLSDQMCCSSGYSLSPDSVLTTKFHTILSGKEITTEEEEGGGGNLIGTQVAAEIHVEESPKRRKVKGKSKGKKTTSKSLSELEFKELKGFMDLGFVFSEEDKDSSLVSIIPGLQRLGKKDGEKYQEKVVAQSTVSRPYLSEAWEVLDRRTKENTLMNWRVPALSNEIDMKDSLRWWAHTVASTLR